MTVTHRALEPIEIVAADGVVLRGQQWLGGPGWVVLLHDDGENDDLDCWRPLAPALASRGSSVLAVDLRGHGASDGEWSVENAGDDLTEVLAFARQHGVTHLSVVAAGASACRALRITSSAEIDSMVLLSPRIPADGKLATLRGAGESKLFIVGSADLAARSHAERLRKTSIGWALLVNLPTTEQGTALLHGKWSEHVQEQIARFLAEQRFLAGQRRPPGARREDDAGRDPTMTLPD